jgi:hypothetical protein
LSVVHLLQREVDGPFRNLRTAGKRRLLPIRPMSAFGKSSTAVSGNGLLLLRVDWRHR